MSHACFSSWECSISIYLIIRLEINRVKRFVTRCHFLQQIISDWISCWNPWIIFWFFRISVLNNWFFSRRIIAYNSRTGVRIEYHLHCLGCCCCLLLITCIKFFNGNTWNIRWIWQNNKIDFIMKFFWVSQLYFKTTRSNFILRFFPSFF